MDYSGFYVHGVIIVVIKLRGHNTRVCTLRGDALIGETHLLLLPLETRYGYYANRRR